MLFAWLCWLLQFLLESGGIYADCKRDTACADREFPDTGVKDAGLGVDRQEIARSRPRKSSVGAESSPILWQRCRPRW